MAPEKLHGGGWVASQPPPRHQKSGVCPTPRPGLAWPVLSSPVLPCDLPCPALHCGLIRHALGLAWSASNVSLVSQASQNIAETRFIPRCTLVRKPGLACQNGRGSFFSVRQAFHMLRIDRVFRMWDCFFLASFAHSDTDLKEIGMSA